MEKRQEIVNRFQSDDNCRVAILSILTCSEGITLTAANRVVFAELYWVPGIIEQAESRAHRIGTDHSVVLVDFLIVSGTPDDIIYNVVQRKKSDTSHIFDGKAVGMDAFDSKFRKRSRDGFSDVESSNKVARTDITKAPDDIESVPSSCKVDDFFSEAAAMDPETVLELKLLQNAKRSSNPIESSESESSSSVAENSDTSSEEDDSSNGDETGVDNGPQAQAKDPVANVENIRSRILSNVTEQRLAAVLSKHGRVDPGNKDACRKLLDDFKKDVREALEQEDSDGLRSFPELLVELDKLCRKLITRELLAKKKAVAKVLA